MRAKYHKYLKKTLNILVKRLCRDSSKVIKFIYEHEGQMKVLINTRGRSNTLHWEEIKMIYQQR